MSELHQRNLQQQPRIGGVAHLDQHLTEALHCPDDGRRSDASREFGDFGRPL